MKTILFLLTALLSLNSWSMNNKRLPTLNWMPEGKCSFNSSFLVPGTDIRVYEIQVLTSRRGTGCQVGEVPTFWKKCDVRDNEDSEGSEPRTELIIKLRDNQTLRNSEIVSIPMIEPVERRASVDRLGNYLSLHETTSRKNIEIAGSQVHVLVKRIIPKIKENKIITEIQFFKPGNPKQKKKSQFLHQSRCTSEFSDKSF